MRLNNIPITNITDPAWLYYLFRIQAFGHKDHDEKIFYNVVLPGLLQATVSEAVEKSGKDQWMVPETLQRSGVCYYRCILTATRYSMRRLGLKQNQVKQMLHCIRRGYLTRVTEDLKKSHQSVQEPNPNDPSQRGLYPSQVSLVRLAANQVGYSAIKESESGRMNEATLKEIVKEVEKVEDLVHTLPVFGGPQEYQNKWMEKTLAETKSEIESNANDVAGNFNNPTVMKQTLNADLSSFHGKTVVEGKPPPLDFSYMPKRTEDIKDVIDLTSTIVLTHRMCIDIHQNTTERIGTRLLEISSLVEHVVLELLPFPTFNDRNNVVFDIDSGQTYYDLLQCFNDLSVMYTMCSESMILRGSQPTRVVTRKDSVNSSILQHQHLTTVFLTPFSHFFVFSSIFYLSTSFILLSSIDILLSFYHHEHPHSTHSTRDSHSPLISFGRRCVGHVLLPHIT